MEKLSAEKVLQVLPGSWHGLFKSLMTGDSPLELATAWYQDATESQYGHIPVWRDLLYSLTVREPVINNNDLNFVSRLLHFTTSTQKHFLSFLMKNSHLIPKTDLKYFLEKMKVGLDPDCWQNEQLRQLQHFSQTTSSGGKSPFPVLYEFTEANRTRVNTLCNKLKKLHDILPGRKLSLPTEIDLVSTELTLISEVGEPASEVSCGNAVSIATEEEDVTSHVIELDSSTDSTNSRPPSKIARLESPSLPTYLDSNSSFRKSMVVFSETREETLDNLKELWQSNTPSQHHGDLEVMLNFTSEEMITVCQKLGLSTMSEESIATACAHIATVSDLISYNSCVIFLSSSILGKVTDMTQTASRTLASTITSMAATFPKQLIDGVLAPCIQTGISTQQADLINRVLLEALHSPSDRLYFFKKVIEKDIVFTECTLVVLQTFIDKKCCLEDSDIGRLINLLHGSAGKFEKNLKFGKLLVAIVNTYGQQLNGECIDSLQNITDKHSTFLKKTLIASVKKLKKK